MRNRFKLLVLFFVLLLTAILTACSSPVMGTQKNTLPTSQADVLPTPTVNPIDQIADENKILSDLGSNSGYATQDLGIKKVTITRRQTNKDDKNDIVYCEVSSENSDINLISYYKLTYNFYDVGGWILDETLKDREDNWAYKPLKEITSENIAKSLIGIDIKVDGLWEHNGGDSYSEKVYFDHAGWNIAENDVKSITIKDRNTDIQNFVDDVTVDIVLKTIASKATGTLKLKYTFEDKEWVLDDFNQPEKFDISFTSKKFKLSDSTIIKNLRSLKPQIGTGDAFNSTSDARIGKKYLCEKGLITKVVAAYDTLKMSYVDYTFSVVMSYEYNGSKWVFKGAVWGDKSGKVKKSK